jgi:hypothetical protein
MTELTEFNLRMASFIEGLPPDETVLIPLYEAYRAANEAIVSVGKQPDVRGVAAEIIASEGRRAADFASAVAAKLSQLSVVEDSWRERFIETMVSHVFFVGGSAGDVVRVRAAASALPVKSGS